jgi:hypothetical protein
MFPSIWIPYRLRSSAFVRLSSLVFVGLGVETGDQKTTVSSSCDWRNSLQWTRPHTSAEQLFPLVNCIVAYISEDGRGEFTNENHNLYAENDQPI